MLILKNCNMTDDNGRRCKKPVGHVRLPLTDDRLHSTNCDPVQFRELSSRIQLLSDEKPAPIDGTYFSGHNGELTEVISTDPAYAKLILPDWPASPESSIGTRPTSIDVHLNLEELLVGDSNRLRYINRFSTALVAHRENVAEHSFYVAWYSLLIAMDAQQRGYDISLQRVLTKAIVHDVEEARTGDIYRPFKVSNPALKNLLHECAKDEMLTLLHSLTDNATISSLLYLDWDGARDESPEGCIVAFADYLGVLAHMLQELRIANMTMKTHYDSMIQYVREFDDAKYDFIRPLILDAEAMVTELLGQKSQSLER